MNNQEYHQQEREILVGGLIVALIVAGLLGFALIWIHFVTAAQIDDGQEIEITQRVTRP